jgi:hypothetical protein
MGENVDLMEGAAARGWGSHRCRLSPVLAGGRRVCDTTSMAETHRDMALGPQSGGVNTASTCHLGVAGTNTRPPPPESGNGGFVQSKTTCLPLRRVRSQQQRRRADGRWPGRNQPT